MLANTRPEAFVLMKLRTGRKQKGNESEASVNEQSQTTCPMVPGGAPQMAVLRSAGSVCVCVGGGGGILLRRQYVPLSAVGLEPTGRKADGYLKVGRRDNKEEEEEGTMKGRRPKQE